MTGDEFSVTNAHARMPSPDGANPPLRILVVEDDRALRQSNAKLLFLSGYAVAVAEDGAAAWDALNASPYDLLITDNSMPKVTGLELLMKLRTARMGLPVIMATGALPTRELNENPWLHPVALLVKPYADDQLLDAVKTVLRAIFPERSQPVAMPKTIAASQERERDTYACAAGNNIVPFGHDYFAHPMALVDEGASIGRGTRVWAFSHILGGAILGEDCNVCDHTFIEGGVRVGHRVTIKCGVYLWDGLTIEDDVFIGPGATFTNDNRPRSQRRLKEYLQTVLKNGCALGANSTMLPGITIGRWAMVGAGAVVTRSVPDYALVVGNPARFRAWICRCGEKLAPASGGLLTCACGQSFEQITANEVRKRSGAGKHPMAR